MKAAKLFSLAFLYQFHIIQISEVHLNRVNSIKVANYKIQVAATYLEVCVRNCSEINLWLVLCFII